MNVQQWMEEHRRDKPIGRTDPIFVNEEEYAALVEEWRRQEEVLTDPPEPEVRRPYFESYGGLKFCGRPVVRSLTAIDTESKRDII
jgi:hypothetical protein